MLATSGYLTAMLWYVCCLRVQALSQYWWGVILFCAVERVCGVFYSNVSRVGISLLSRAMSDACMVLQNACGVVGDGACLRSTIMGAMSS